MMPLILNLAVMCKKFIVIGISDSRELFLPPRVLDIIAGSRVFSGGVRHHGIVASLLPADAVWIDISVPLEAVYEQYRKYDSVVVFASGDPLFYGFAVTLRREFPDAAIEVLPAFNSLQTLAHKMLLPYADMRCVSLTGRGWEALDAALISGEKIIGALTDHHKTPAAVASRMLEYGYDNYRVTVGEQLGNEEREKVRTLSLAEAARLEFSTPNCLILERTSQRFRPLGLPEGEFDLLDGRVNMITKAPIRLLTLSKLDLARRTSFWDIGFCTGSVSIEARLCFPHLKVTAFEVRPQCEAIIAANARRFGAPGIGVVMEDFLIADLDSLPRPDAVFIGGHGGHLPEFLQRIREVLLPGGAVVFNSVSETSRLQFIEAAEAAGMRITASTRVAIDSFNPIEILRAE